MRTDISSINEDLKYEEAGWTIQRVFWLLMSLVLTYGLMGGLGDNSGILSRKTIALSNGVQVEYERFMRVEKSTEMKIGLDTAVQNCTIALNKDYIDKVRITQIIPEPEKTEIINNRIIYSFNSLRAGTVTFYKDPTAMGSIELNIDINGQSASISQYTYF